MTEIVTTGYRLPFMRLPDPVCELNHKSALGNATFVTAAIEQLVAGRCVSCCMACLVICSPLSVVTNARGEQRLVLDLRYLNQFLPDRKFKYEGLSIIPSLFCQGDYFSVFDLKSGYHHVDIHQDCWPYLGFSWGVGLARRWYTFRVLPFGLSTACYVFTKLMRPLVKRWRSLGFRCIVYIDDGICTASSEQRCMVETAQIVSDLECAGFVLNSDKSRLKPQQIGPWLGFIINLVEGKFMVPEEKVSKLVKSIESILAPSLVHVRQLASCVGQIISMSLAVGPVARLRTRALYGVNNSRHSWADRLPLPAAAQEELVFWKSCLAQFNGQPIWFSPGATRVVYSDASSSGYGGHAVEVGPWVAHGQWSAYEATLSSTWRELKAVFMVLCSLAPKLAGNKV